MGSIRMYQLALELTAGFDISKQVSTTNLLYVEAMSDLENMRPQFPEGFIDEFDLTIRLWEFKCRLKLMELAVRLAGDLSSDECLDDKLIVRKIALALGKPIPKEAQED